LRTLGTVEKKSVVEVTHRLDQEGGILSGTYWGAKEGLLWKRKVLAKGHAARKLKRDDLQSLMSIWHVGSGRADPCPSVMHFSNEEKKKVTGVKGIWGPSFRDRLGLRRERGIVKT